MKTFRVRNFEKFQHYKDRSPPWIKLYTNILENYEFGALTDASKSHLILIWLLASRTEGTLPYDAEWISRSIHAHGKVNLEELANAEFIVVDQGGKQDASKPLDQRQRERQSQKKDILSNPPEEDLTAIPDSLDRRKLVEADWLSNFEAWYEAYPLKKGRGQALKAYKTARGKASQSDLLAGVEAYKRGKPDYADWCHPATWLNGERWLDEAKLNSEDKPISPEEALRDTAKVVKRILHHGAIRPEYWPPDYPVPEKMALMIEHGLLTEQEAHDWTQSGKGVDG